MKIKNLKLSFFLKFFLALTIFSIPFSLRTLIYDQSAYSTGMFSEPTAIFLNITEILLWLTLLIYLLGYFSPASSKISNLFKSKISRLDLKRFIRIKPRNVFLKTFKNKVFSFLALFFIINLFSAFFSKNPTLSLFFSFKILEGIIFAFLLTQKILSTKDLSSILLGLGIFEGGVALMQFVLQHDLGLQILGEPHLNPQTLGVAKMEVGGETLIRGYGTFLHPNILAAFFVLLFFYFDAFGRHYLKYIFLFFLIFTLSRSGFLAIFTGLIVKSFLHLPLLEKGNILLQRKQKRNSSILKNVFSLLFFFTILLLPLYYFFPERFSLDNAFFERLDLIQISWQMFGAHPFGVGNSNFIFNIQDFVPQILKPWEMQPVHNLYLLILNENGIFALASFIAFLFFLFSFVFRKQKQFLPLLSAILFLGFFDHYFWDIDQGRWLFSFCSGILLTKN